MFVTIVGGGKVGTYIARDLCGAGHEVTIIEQNPDVVARVMPTLDVHWIADDACEPTTLQRASLEKADVMVAATGDDEDNLVISLLAKQEFGVPRVIARVNHPKNEWLFNETWGVDVAVSTPHLLTALVEEAVSVGSMVRLLQLEGGNARLVEVTLAGNSPAAGHTIADLGLPRDGTVVAVIRKDHVIVPDQDTMLETGDEVMVLVTEDVELDIKRALIGTN